MFQVPAQKKVTRKDQLRRCLLTCQDENEELEPIVFNVPATYNEKVKIHDWQVRGMAEPRDNKEIFPPKGNLHVASYDRLGSQDDASWTTETRAMLAQIELKHQYEPIQAQRSLLNVRSLAYAEEEDEDRDVRLIDVLTDPEELRCKDYRSTMELDYRLPYPLKPRPPPPPPPPEPWLLYRRTIGYTPEHLEKRDGLNTFLDDNMQLHRRIAEVKNRRRDAWLFLSNETQENRLKIEKGGEESPVIAEEPRETMCH